MARSEVLYFCLLRRDAAKGVEIKAEGYLVVEDKDGKRHELKIGQDARFEAGKKTKLAS